MKPFLNAALVVVLASVPATTLAQSQVERGQEVFTAQKCFVCHSVAGQGNKKGPLDGIGAKLSADEIRQWIVNSTDMAKKAKAERKPEMKPFTSLPKDELDALVAYVQSLKK